MNQPGPAAPQPATTSPSGSALLMAEAGAASTPSARRRRNDLSGWHSASPAVQPEEQTCGQGGEEARRRVSAQTWRGGRRAVCVGSLPHHTPLAAGQASTPSQGAQCRQRRTLKWKVVAAESALLVYSRVYGSSAAGRP